MANPKICQTTLLLKTFFILLVIVSQISENHCANILFYISFGGPSHRIAATPLANALANKGHNVTMLVQDKPKDEDLNTSKINYYIPLNLANNFERVMMADGPLDHFKLRQQFGFSLTMLFLPRCGQTACDLLFSDVNFVQWLKSSHFDLVFVDGLFNECGYIAAYMHQAKIILFSVSTIIPAYNDPMGIPEESSWIPDMMFHFTPNQMTFIQRLVTAVTPVIWRLYRNLVYLPKLKEIAVKGLGMKELPDISKLERNISLMFVNAHHSQEFARSLPPSIIPVGGISLVEGQSKPLPDEMAKFIDTKSGFVYVSFGSMIGYSALPPQSWQYFVNTFRNFPELAFIWKMDKAPDNLPDNVYIDKWMPQQDVLNHPKIKMFIAHSGVGGINEAIYAAVPMICFPIFAEQDYNAHLVEQKGFGIRMEITSVTETTLTNSIHSILNDKSFQTSAEKASSLFRDRPMTAVESAVWWTEFVLRQDDTSSLWPTSTTQSWWIKRQLDVWLFVGTLFVTFSIIFVVITQKVIRRFLPR